MKIALCSRSTDSHESARLEKALLARSNRTISILRETARSQDWKHRITRKLTDADFVLFVVSSASFQSDAINWEYATAKGLNKRIIGFAIACRPEDSILYSQGFPVFDDVADCWNYIQATYHEDRMLLIEQYKIMVSSTEKVTDQRLRVNNLFFTVTSSIVSIGLVIGKAFEFSPFGALSLAILAGMAFFITFLWEKLIRSYGTLNRGKFIVIDNIEKQLRTNMFEHEWKILTEEIGYEPNTNTEATVVRRLRYFILAVAIAGGFLAITQSESAKSPAEQPPETRSSAPHG